AVGEPQHIVEKHWIQSHRMQSGTWCKTSRGSPDARREKRAARQYKRSTASGERSSNNADGLRSSFASYVLHLVGHREEGRMPVDLAVCRFEIRRLFTGRSRGDVGRLDRPDAHAFVAS